MPFEHAAGKAWSRLLNAISASRPPNVKVVGQEVEDAIRLEVLLADLSNLAEPIRWAQAATRRQTAGVAAQVARVELHCQAPGGLWVDEILLSTGNAVLEVLETPASTPDRTTVVDFGNIPTVSLVGSVSVVEAAPLATEPLLTGGGFAGRWGIRPWYLPFGRVLALKASAQNTTINVEMISWREIPA